MVSSTAVLPADDLVDWIFQHLKKKYFWIFLIIYKLFPNIYLKDFDELKEHNEQAIAIDDSIIEEFEEPTSKIELSQQTSSNSETGQNIRTSR